MRTGNVGYAVRDLAMRLRCAARRRSPALFVNSIPKSGTHLLSTLLELHGLASIGHYTEHDANLARREFEKPRDERAFATGHVTTYAPPATCRLILMVRSPHHVALSLANYISARRDHHLHRRFMAMDTTARLQAVVHGMDGLEPLETRYHRFLEWARANRPHVVDYDRLGEGDLTAVSNAVGATLSGQTLERALDSRTMTSRNPRMYGKPELERLKLHCRDTRTHDRYQALVALAEVPTLS